MALSPQRIRDTTFKSAKRGYDQAEVNTFVVEVATALESAQNEATAMEARARAAVARLQELSQQQTAPPTEAAADVHPSVDEAATISRTLLLAQRTADTTVADAQAEADRVLAAARDEAAGQLDAARDDAARLLDEAKAEARRAGESERVRVEGEVQALLARRDFLESDVDHLEQYLVAQRERIVEAVASLNDLVQRVPDGLADMRRPLLSAAAEPSRTAESAGVDGHDEPVDDDDDPFAVDGVPSEEGSEIAEITKIAEAAPTIDGSRQREGVDSTPSASASPLFEEDGEPTVQMGAVNRQDR